jgi:hypothetical protein
MQVAAILGAGQKCEGSPVVGAAAAAVVAAADVVEVEIGAVGAVEVEAGYA